MRQATPIEWLLIRDRWLIGGSLLLATALCWAWIVPMARDMYGPMTGPSAWMMTRRWDGVHLLLLLAMWVVMMAGMMLPSAAPTLLLYACVVRKSCERHATTSVYAFAAGYLVLWTLFSVAATALQWALAQTALLSPMMELRNRACAGALLVLAGLYQLTPLKRTCLQSCRSPAAFITRHWQRGWVGAFKLGLAHGWFCLGCCWALMLLLFVGGVMNLWCIAALTVFVLLEKMAPLGLQGGRLSGVLLAGVGLWTLSR